MAAKTATASYTALPETGYVRQFPLVAHPKTKAPGIFPFSASKLWRMVKAGEFPAPVKLSERVTAWKVEDIRAWMQARNGD